MEYKSSFQSQLLSYVCYPCMIEIQFRFCHLPKKEEIVELHFMLFTISPFMFWDDPKTFSESILFSLIFFVRNEIPRLPIAVLKEP